MFSKITIYVIPHKFSSKLNSNFCSGRTKICQMSAMVIDNWPCPEKNQEAKVSHTCDTSAAQCFPQVIGLCWVTICKSF